MDSKIFLITWPSFKTNYRRLYNKLNKLNIEQQILENIQFDEIFIQNVSKIIFMMV